MITLEEITELTDKTIRLYELATDKNGKYSKNNLVKLKESIDNNRLFIIPKLRIKSLFSDEEKIRLKSLSKEEALEEQSRFMTPVFESMLIMLETTIDNIRKDAAVYSILCWEEEPGLFEYRLGLINDTHIGIAELSYNISTGASTGDVPAGFNIDPSDLTVICMHLMRVFHRDGIIKFNSRARLTKASKITGKTIRVNSIVMVGLTKKEYKENGNGFIQYWNRYWRMGHWRRIDPSYTGKNRSGERVLKGITWVSEAIVGDNYLPLKPQTYIATPEDL